jgi:hypothetical protein
VPFDANQVQNFKLDEVPTLTKVINELGSVLKRDSGNSDDTAQLPSMEPYIEIFRKHIKKCIIKQEKLSLEMNKMDDDQNGQTVQF